MTVREDMNGSGGEGLAEGDAFDDRGQFGSVVRPFSIDGAKAFDKSRWPCKVVVDEGAEATYVFL